MKLGEFLSKDNIAMLFLQNAYVALVSDCKDTKKTRHSIIQNDH